ncbi:hypothetical protein F5884DRAFT_371803 [Xylogone sp. PMI_703]|nr:hypothetical protein F5884DRAFT_371803 [Xylogone sp. PMI_703]
MKRQPKRSGACFGCPDRLRLSTYGLGAALTARIPDSSSTVHIRGLHRPALAKFSSVLRFVLSYFFIVTLVYQHEPIAGLLFLLGFSKIAIHLNHVLLLAPRVNWYSGATRHAGSPIGCMWVINPSNPQRPWECIARFWR